MSSKRENTKDEAQLAQFLNLYHQGAYRVTTTVTDTIQQKPTYHSSGRRLSGSGSGFSGSFLVFLVLGLLVIDGFDSSARFAGFSFRGFLFLVLLVLALLVLGGGFSGFSSSSGSSSQRNRNLRGQRHDLSISLFSLFSLYSINHQRCKSYKGRIRQQQQPFFLVLQPREFLRLHHQGEYIIPAITITTNTTYTTKSSGKSKKRAVTWMLRREESGCFLLAYRITKDLVYLVYSKNVLLVALLGCYPILIDALSYSLNFDIDEFRRGRRRIGEKKKKKNKNKEKRRKEERS